MHSTCLLSGCKEPEQTFLAALRHVRGHISCFLFLIKYSSDGGVGWGGESWGWMEEKQMEEAGKATVLAISR